MKITENQLEGLRLGNEDAWDMHNIQQLILDDLDRLASLEAGSSNGAEICRQMRERCAADSPDWKRFDTLANDLVVREGLLSEARSHLADETSRRLTAESRIWSIERDLATAHARLGNNIPTHRHIKTGDLYRVLCRALNERDGQQRMVVYQSCNTGSTWVRDAEEFDDGLFVALSVDKPPRGAQ